MKVLLLEDEIKTGQSIKTFLSEEHNLEVIWHHDGISGYEAARTQHFDIIVSDIMMPGKTGMEICKSLRENNITTPFLFLTALSEVDDKIQGLNSGADDYLVKPFDIHELLARINALSRRINPTKEIHQKLVFADLELDQRTLEVFRAGQKIILTPKEFSLLEYLILNKNRVIPKTEILEKIWNIDEEINTNVIEVYVSYVRNKIDKNFSTKLIHTHFGVGYYMKEQ